MIGDTPTDVRQQGPGSHSSFQDPLPPHSFVLAPVLGEDKIDQYVLGTAARPGDGRLSPNPAGASLQLPAGFGPRHLAFSPADASVVLVANEGGPDTPVRVTACTFNATSGTLTAAATLSAISAGADPSGLFPAEVLFAPDGRFAYVSVRDATDAKRDSVATFAVDAAGTFTLIGNAPTGHYPRSMALDPSGRVLVVADQKGNTVRTLMRDAATGLLAPSHVEPLPDAAAFVMVYE